MVCKDSLVRDTVRQEMAKQGDLESCKLFLSVISTLSDVMEDLEMENIYYFLFYVNMRLRLSWIEIMC